MDKTPRRLRLYVVYTVYYLKCDQYLQENKRIFTEKLKVHILVYVPFLYFYMLFVYFYIKCKVVPNTSNFKKYVRRHMTNMMVLVIKENMRYY